MVTTSRPMYVLYTYMEHLGEVLTIRYVDPLAFLEPDRHGNFPGATTTSTFLDVSLRTCRYRRLPEKGTWKHHDSC